MVFSFIQNISNASNTAKKLLSTGVIATGVTGVAPIENLINLPPINNNFNAYDPVTYVTAPVYGITNHLFNNMTSFYSFLNDNKIIASTIGIVIGLQMNALWGALTDDIINPITKKLVNKNVDDLNFCILGVTFYYGKIMNGLINIFISFFLLYKLYELSKSLGLK